MPDLLPEDYRSQGPASGDSKFILSARRRTSRVRRPCPSRAQPRMHSSRLTSRCSFRSCCCSSWVRWPTLFEQDLHQKANCAGSSNRAGTSARRPAAQGLSPRPDKHCLDPGHCLRRDSRKHGRGLVARPGFLCERAILSGGTLQLRQGAGSVPDLGVSIELFAKTGEELSGKVIEITPEREPPQPRVVLRWRADTGKGKSKPFPGGYLLRLVFGQANGGKMPGKVFLALPDDQAGVLAGTFMADIRKPPRRNRQSRNRPNLLQKAELQVGFCP